MSREPRRGRAIRAALAAENVHPSKRLGQSFMDAPGIVAAVVEAVGDDALGSIIEIGPGLGALTLPLSERARRLIAVEIDRRLATRLREFLSDRANTVTVVAGDILEFDFASVSKEAGERLVVVGSIPYSITAPILKRIVSQRAVIRRAILVTQREVAEKIAASPGKEGSALGVYVQAYGDVKILRRIPRGAFYPVPEVDSTLWSLQLRPKPRFETTERVFFTIVRTLYGSRRKTARNALRQILSAEDVESVLAEAGVDGMVRGETLGFPELDALARAIEAGDRLRERVAGGDAAAGLSL